MALKAFSIGILRLIDIVRDIVNRAAAYEEEDFQPLTYGFKLAPDITDLRAAGMLKEAEDELQRKIRNGKISCFVLDLILGVQRLRGIEFEG